MLIQLGSHLKNNRLRLHAIPAPANAKTLYDIPQIVSQKFPAPSFTATTMLEFKPESEHDCAGFIVTGRQYAALKVKHTDNGLTIYKLSGNQSDSETIECEIIVDQHDVTELYLRVEVKEGAKCQFSYSADGKTFKKIGNLFSATPGQWIGSQVGMFCMNESPSTSPGYTDFYWFTVQK